MILTSSTLPFARNIRVGSALVVGAQLFHLKGEERQTLLQEVGSLLLVLLLVYRKVRQPGRPVDSHEAVTLLALELWQVKTVPMKQSICTKLGS